MSNMRQTHHNQDLLIHLNINSIQNKFDELKEINKALKASLLILTETKIDCSYPNNQFKLTGYRIYRNDRAKGGGGVLAYVKTGIAVKRLKLSRDYKTLASIALDIEIGENNSIVLGLYRPPSRLF